MRQEGLLIIGRTTAGTAFRASGEAEPMDSAGAGTSGKQAALCKTEKIFPRRGIPFMQAADPFRMLVLAHI